MSRVLVFGGYGTFGRLVAVELARLGLPVTIAGRDGARAEAQARTLPPAPTGAHRGLAADLTRPETLARVLEGHAVAASCAGPFSALGEGLLAACLDARCHYADIADDRDYVRRVRAWDERFREADLVAAYGCSSLPALSGALGLAARRPGDPPRRARVTLFIGNDNPTGQAAIRSAVGIIGRPIAAPQGTLRGFGHREVVALPPPFGRRAVYDFESPEYDIFPPLLGVREISVKVGFELRAATWAFALLSRLSSSYGDRTARLLAGLGGLGGGIGSSGGAVVTELFYDDGQVRRAAISSPTEGQRMAALPCALVAQHLAGGVSGEAGARTAYEVLGAGALLERLAASGFALELPA